MGVNVSLASGQAKVLGFSQTQVRSIHLSIEWRFVFRHRPLFFPHCFSFSKSSSANYRSLPPNKTTDCLLLSTQNATMKQTVRSVCGTFVFVICLQSWTSTYGFVSSDLLAATLTPRNQPSNLVPQLRGGYDATVTNPNLPIEFYTLKGGMCPYAARTHMVLMELGLEFTTIHVERNADWYRRINPRGKVPALRVPADDNIVIYESAICNEYLCDYCSSNNPNAEVGQLLLPSSASLRARIRLLNDHFDTVVASAQFTFLMNKDPQEDASLADKLMDGLQVFEDILQDGREFLTGSGFTLADVHILPFVTRLIISLGHFKGFDLPEDRFSKFLAWYSRCSTRESVIAATPSKEQILETYEKFVKADYSFGGLNTKK